MVLVRKEKSRHVKNRGFKHYLSHVTVDMLHNLTIETCHICNEGWFDGMLKSISSHCRLCSGVLTKNGNTGKRLYIA